MYLTARFNAVRALVGQREPLILEVMFRNDESESALASVFVKIPFSLGFDKAGLEREIRRRLGYVKPADEKVVPIPIYVRSTTKEGMYPILVKAQLHFDSYDKVKKEITYDTTLRVVKP
jgi:hypothetical protein